MVADEIVPNEEKTEEIEGAETAQEAPVESEAVKESVVSEEKPETEAPAEEA